MGGLLLIVLVAIPARLEFAGSKITAFEIAIPLCLLMELRQAFLQKRSQLVPPATVTLALVGFYLFSLASGFWALSGSLWFVRVGVLSEAFAAGWAVYLGVSRLGTQVFLRIFVWSSTLGAAWSLTWFYILGRPDQLNLQKPLGVDKVISQSLRLGSPLLGPSNYYAGFLLLSIPVTFYLCKEKKVYWLPLIIQLAALTATLSRGAAIALVVASAIILAIRLFQGELLPKGFALVSGGIVAVALAPQIPGVVRTLLAQRQQATLTGAGYQARADLWQVAFELWRGHPLVGIGSNNWSAAVTTGYSGGAHNVLLQILAELGLFGVVLAVFALGAVLATVWKIRDARLRFCLLVGAVGSFINCLSEATFEGVVFTWFLGAYLGGALAMSVKDR